MASNSQRMLSLWLPRFATDRIARSREAQPLAPSPRLRGEGDEHCASHAGRGEGGLVIYGKRGNADVLTAVDDAAARRGLSVGLALAQARAMHPTLAALPEDPQADATLLEKFADWCLRYTPLVACDSPDGLLLDIS